MKRAFVVLMLFGAVPIYAATVYRSTVAATSTAATVTLSDRAIELEMFNFGSSAVYVDFDGGTASSTSTTSVRIGKCDVRRLSWQYAPTTGPSTLSVATAAGETTSLDVEAFFVPVNRAAGASFAQFLSAHPSCAGSNTVTTLSSSLSGANGESVAYGQTTELITLSTGGTTTDSTANMLPASSIIDAVVCRVTTTITTATEWSVGVSGATERFISMNVGLASGTTAVGIDHMAGSIASDATGPTQTAAAKLRITTTGTPGAGAIRCTAFYRTFTAPTS